MQILTTAIQAFQKTQDFPRDKSACGKLQGNLGKTQFSLWKTRGKAVENFFNLGNKRSHQLHLHERSADSSTAINRD